MKAVSLILYENFNDNRREPLTLLMMILVSTQDISLYTATRKEFCVV